MELQLLNQWLEKGDRDLLCLKLHECEKHVGIVFILLGLGVGLHFDRIVS